MFKKLQDWFIDYLTKNLLRLIRKRDVFQIVEERTTSGKLVKHLVYRDRKSSQEFQDKMKIEAMNVKDSAIWKMVSTRARWQVYEEMFHTGKNENDIRAGKMALYVVSLIEGLFDDLSEL